VGSCQIKDLIDLFSECNSERGVSVTEELVTVEDVELKEWASELPATKRLSFIKILDNLLGQFTYYTHN